MLQSMSAAATPLIGATLSTFWYASSGASERYPPKPRSRTLPKALHASLGTIVSMPIGNSGAPTCLTTMHIARAEVKAIP